MMTLMASSPTLCSNPLKFLRHPGGSCSRTSHMLSHIGTHLVHGEGKGVPCRGRIPQDCISPNQSFFHVEKKADVAAERGALVNVHAIFAFHINAQYLSARLTHKLHAPQDQPGCSTSGAMPSMTAAVRGDVIMTAPWRIKKSGPKGPPSAAKPRLLPDAIRGESNFLERATGVEPATSSLGSLHSAS